MMHQNLIWKGLVVVLGIVALWFTCVVVYDLIYYLRLNRTTVPSVLTWSVKELNDEQFALQANYIIKIEGSIYPGTSQLQEIPFRNAWAAEKAIPDLEKREWIVWYSSSDPQHSTLQKYFPTKEFFSAILLWGLFAYFIGLGYYVAKVISREKTKR